MLICSLVSLKSLNYMWTPGLLSSKSVYNFTDVMSSQGSSTLIKQPWQAMLCNSQLFVAISVENCDLCHCLRASYWIGNAPVNNRTLNKNLITLTITFLVGSHKTIKSLYNSFTTATS